MKTGFVCMAIAAAILIGFAVGRLILGGQAARLVSADGTVAPVKVGQNAKKQMADSSAKQTTSVKPPVTPQPSTTSASNPAGASNAKSTASPAPAIPAGRSLYVNSGSSYAQAARAYAVQHQEYAAVLQRLTAQPMAEWFGGWNANVQADANQYVTAASGAGQVPVLIAYNIPNRDCGSFSAGGVADANAYHSWIQSLANGIGSGRPAIVIVEPDALAAGCFSTDRARILQDAVAVLRSSTSASIYLDAGHANWIDARTMAARLTASGIAGATGFSLNISNFQSTAANTAYGTQLSQATGGKHFLIDTSRNGNGPTADGQWCNPAGRAIGQPPTLTTGQSLIDAYVWAHGPGGSDGQCGPDQAGTKAPSAGTWWPESTLEYLRNSGWL